MRVARIEALAQAARTIAQENSDEPAAERRWQAPKSPGGGVTPEPRSIRRTEDEVEREVRKHRHAGSQFDPFQSK